MKRWPAFAAVFALVGGALVASHVRQVPAPVDPRAVLYFIADTERELGRVVMTATRLSDEDEIAIGNEMARENYAANFVRSPDEQAMATYVERVGTQLAARAHRKLPYKFHYIPGGFDNAFALPGGHIYIGGGLIASMDSEDQLAAVLGHELAHADRRHCAERVQIEARMRKLNLGVIGSLTQIPIQVFQAGYSKTQELEADKVGTELAVRAGYSPFGALRLFEKFDAMNREEASRARSPQQEVVRVTISTLSGYFRSHPPAGERMAQLRRMISSNHWESRTQEKPLEIRSN